MGLDMYLEKFPRLNGLTREDIAGLAYRHRTALRNNTQVSLDDLDWSNTKKQIGEDLIATAYVTYYDWDTEHRLPCSSLQQEVGYWRKANAIHMWFVDNVQNGEDDCCYHREVTEDDLLDLRYRCKTIIESTVMVNTKIKNGMHYDFDSQTWQAIMEDGKAVLNPDICEQMLPTTDGFFFGSTEYDQWYMDDIVYTYELCETLLKETDFENEMLFYLSSW